MIFLGLVVSCGVDIIQLLWFLSLVFLGLSGWFWVLAVVGGLLSAGLCGFGWGGILVLWSID